MARVVFTANLARHLPVPEIRVGGATVGEVLDAVFAAQPLLRGYVVDDQGHVRTHVAVFLDGAMLRDRSNLAAPVRDDSEICVLQALSGG